MGGGKMQDRAVAGELGARVGNFGQARRRGGRLGRRRCRRWGHGRERVRFQRRGGIRTFGRRSGQRRDGRLDGRAARWRIGGGVGLGRQHVDGDLGAVAKLVERGFLVGLELDHGRGAVEMPAGALHPGGLARFHDREIGLGRRFEAQLDAALTGIGGVGDGRRPVENETREIGIFPDP